MKSKVLYFNSHQTRPFSANGPIFSTSFETSQQEPLLVFFLLPLLLTSLPLWLPATWWRGTTRPGRTWSASGHPGCPRSWKRRGGRIAGPGLRSTRWAAEAWRCPTCWRRRRAGPGRLYHQACSLFRRSRDPFLVLRRCLWGHPPSLPGRIRRPWSGGNSNSSNNSSNSVTMCTESTCRKEKKCCLN